MTAPQTTAAQYAANLTPHRVYDRQLIRDALTRRGYRHDIGPGLTRSEVAQAQLTLPPKKRAIVPPDRRDRARYVFGKAIQQVIARHEHRLRFVEMNGPQPILIRGRYCIDCDYRDRDGLFILFLIVGRRREPRQDHFTMAPISIPEWQVPPAGEGIA